MKFATESGGVDNGVVACMDIGASPDPILIASGGGGIGVLLGSMPVPVMMGGRGLTIGRGVAGAE